MLGIDSDDSDHSDHLRELTRDHVLFDESDPDSEPEDVKADTPDVEDDVDDDNPQLSETQMEILAALGENSKIIRGCVNYAIYGNCFKGKECKNAPGHCESIAKETRQWLLKKLATIERDGYKSSVPRKDQTKL